MERSGGNRRRLPATAPSAKRAIARATTSSVDQRQPATPNCHAGGRGFESRRSRLLKCLQIGSIVVRSGAIRTARGPIVARCLSSKRPANSYYARGLVAGRTKKNGSAGQPDARSLPGQAEPAPHQRSQGFESRRTHSSGSRRSRASRCGLSQPASPRSPGRGRREVGPGFESALVHRSMSN